MKIQPDYAEIRAAAAAGQYKVYPIHCELLSDFCTPIEALRILKNVSTHCFLLESILDREKWGRYTFLGFDPKLEITCRGGVLKAGSLCIRTDDPAAYLRQVLADYKSPQLPGLPTFTGGLVGYFSYDYLGYSEPSVRSQAADSENFKDVDLMLFDKVIAFDNLRQKIILITNMSLAEPEVNYNKAVLELKQLAQLLRTGEKKAEPRGRLTGTVTPLFDQARYCAMVEQAKYHIREGDIFQVVLSNRLSAPYEGGLLNAYRVLRTVNPSPYMFYLSGTDVEAAGASPETLVKLENGVLHTFPLARMAAAGADLVELGIPFSDPTAEGPVSQEANLRALTAGTTTDKVFDLVRDLRRDVTIPFVFMTYANVVFSYGAERFLSTCAEIGVDGLILPDLPFEEKEEFLPLCRQCGVNLISMIAPTSENRIAMIAKEAEGFLYVVSSLGVTGTRSEIKTDLASIVDVVRRNAAIPCAIGFGISTPEQAHRMASIADGAIVGSAIVKQMAQYGKEAPAHVGEFVRRMKQAL